MTGCLLDTNHVSAALRPVSHLRERLREAHRSGVRIGTCMPVICEVEAGLQGLTRQQESYRRALGHLLKQIKTWPIDGEAARHYGELYQELRSRGRVLSQVDMMVAALARKMGLTLLTSDRDFGALPDIATENWLQ